MSAASLPSFEDFYRAANRGWSPFPWQRRLAAMAATGAWPGEIGVPTGLGKTSCIDVAVWALARQASQAPHERTAPTRTWYVVNRRLLVDAAYDHARRLAALLVAPATVEDEWREADQAAVDALRSTADALRSIAGLPGDPLSIAKLRGGAEIGTRPPDPSRPALVFATVPMFASRWLFRGYGTSVCMRPVDAAHAGVDALVLLDEAHLARPLARLADTATECDPGDPTTLLNPMRARARFVALTATGEGGPARFDLDEADLKDEVVRQRLHARKPTELVETPRKQLPVRLAGLAMELLARRRGSSCVVFCNTVRTARETLGQLEHLRDGRSLDCLLLTGRMRERESQAVRQIVLDPVTGAPADRTLPKERGLVVVATQTLEVGADLDFDYLVTESAGVRAVTQRFGRLNRLGDKPHAAAVVCHATDGEDPVYGPEPGQVWERLQGAGSGRVDMCPARITDVLGPPRDEPPRSGELLAAHLWELAKTSCPPPGEAPPEVFFSALDERVAEVSVFWRCHLPPDSARIVPAVREPELVEVPIGKLRRALQERGIEEVRRLTPDRGSLEPALVAQLRPGDQLAFPATAGMYDRFGWNVAASETVLDVAAIEAGTLWLGRELRTFLGVSALSHELEAIEHILRTLEPDDPEAEPDPEEDLLVGQSILDLLRAISPHPWLTGDEWVSFLEGLDPRVERLAERQAPGLRELPESHALLLRARPQTKGPRRPAVRIEAFDDLSFAVASTLLDDHLDMVGEIAHRVASALGLPPDVVEVLRQAGRVHDLGKADVRFQRWLDPSGTATGMLAKSMRPLTESEANRTAAGWPRGGRHELLSIRLLQHGPSPTGPVSANKALLLHLVASHHGYGRPLVPVVADAAPPPIAATVEGVRVSERADLSLPDFEQPGRFRCLCEHYGVWGLALLEAVLRQADHVASQATASQATASQATEVA